MELKGEEHNVKVSRPVYAPGSPAGATRNIVRVRDIMSRDVVTAALNDTIFSVAKTMLEHSISCVVVVDRERVVGILTEKDMLNSVAGRDIDLHRLRVSERMSSPVDTIAPDVSVLEADQIMEANCVRRLPVVEDGRLVGIVTQTDITRGLISLNSLRYVSDVMTKQVASVQAEATAIEAARLMSSSNISCVVVMHRQDVAGILTEKDVLKRVVALHKDPAQTLVADVMSLPVVTVPPTCSILSASKKMETMHFHRLLVAEDKAVCGIVTQTDIMRAVRSAFDEVESYKRALATELADLIQHTILGLQRVRNFLDGIPDRPARNAAPVDSAAPPVEPPVLIPSASPDR